MQDLTNVKRDMGNTMAELEAELKRQTLNGQQQKSLLDKLKALIENKTEQLRLKDVEMAAEVTRLRGKTMSL